MDGRKLARRRICHGCPHVYWTGVGYEGSKGFRRSCGAGTDRIELDTEYLEGPDTNCPEGCWARRVSVDADGHAVRKCWSHERADTQDCGPADDIEAWQKWNTEKTRKGRREEDKPKIKQIIKAIDDSPDIDADAMTALAVLTAAGSVPGWLADEIQDEMGGSA